MFADFLHSIDMVGAPSHVVSPRRIFYNEKRVDVVLPQSGQYQKKAIVDWAVTEAGG
jgi:hypothetical protein